MSRSHEPEIYSFGKQSWATFKGEQIPDEILLLRAKYFVFNTQGVEIEAGTRGTSYARKTNRRSFFCACEQCSRVPLQRRWKISFTRVTGSSWQLASDYPIDDVSEHRMEDFNIKSPSLLANFALFQDFILNIVYKVKLKRPTKLTKPHEWPYRSIREEFLRAHTAVSITTKSKAPQVEKKLDQFVMYATRSIISHYTKTLITETNPALYQRLASYAKLLDSKNPLATVALQADNQFHFYRFFLAFPIASPSFRSFLTFPVFVADCSHFKDATYDGDLFVLATKTSFNDVILLAIAYIPRENKQHLNWVVEMCLRHGIPIEKHALFTDEGPLLATLSYYKRTRNMHFFPNICTEHFLRNIFKKIGKPDRALREDLRKFIYEASEAEVYEDYRSALESINEILLGRYVDKPSTSYGTMVYILSRHPKTWTVFANSRSFQLHTLECQDSYFLRLQNTYRVLFEVFQTLEELGIVSTDDVQGYFQDAVRCHVSKTPKFKFTSFSSDPCQRFGFRTTNAAEQMANVFKCGHARSVPPPESIKILVHKYNEQCRVLLDKAMKTAATTHDKAFLTPPGLYVKSMWSLQRHEELSESSIQFLSEQILDNGVTVSLKLPCEFDMHSASLKWFPSAQASDSPSHSFHFCCDRHITTTQMFTCPCACYKIVLDKARSHPNCPPTLSEHGFEKLMYPSFYDSINVKRILKSKHGNVLLNVPSGSETKNFIHETLLLPPTKYREGCSGKDERILSRGEVPSRRRGKGKGSHGKAKRNQRLPYSPTSSKRANHLLGLENQHTNHSDKSLRISGVHATLNLLKGRGNPRVRKKTDMTEGIEVTAPSELVGGQYLVLTSSEDHGLPQEGIEDNEDDVDADREGINREDDLEQNIHLIHGPTLQQQLRHIGDFYRNCVQAILDSYYFLSLDIGDFDGDRLEEPEVPESNLGSPFSDDKSTLGTSDEQSGNPYIVVPHPENLNEITYQDYVLGADKERSVFLSDKYQELLRSTDKDVVQDNALSKFGDEGNPVDDRTVQKTATPFAESTGPEDIGYISGLLHAMMTKMSDFEVEGTKILTTFNGTKIRSIPMAINYFDQLMKTLSDSSQWLRSGLVDDFIQILNHTINNDFVKIYSCLSWQGMLCDVTEEADGVKYVVSRFSEDNFFRRQEHAQYTLFEQDLVLVPMTDRKHSSDPASHFFLCIIVPSETTVFIYDSMWDGRNSSTSENPILKYEKQPEIEMFLKSKEKLDKTHNHEWTFKAFHGTVQKNSYDCGVFALAAILALYNNFDRRMSLERRLEPLCRFYADDYYITKFRYCAFFSILSGSLIYPKASTARPSKHKRPKPASSQKPTETGRKSCTKTLFERIKLCRLPTTEKANSPAKRVSKFVRENELRAWLMIHGIRYLSSDRIPALIEKSQKATTNYDLVTRTLKESWTMGREALLEREELITKMNNLKSSRSKNEEKFLSNWFRSSNHDFGEKLVGTLCASGRRCFFSARCIAGDLKGQCPRCENPVHDTVCLDSISGVCLECMRNEENAPTTPSKRLQQPAGVTPSPKSTSHAGNDGFAGGADSNEDVIKEDIPDDNDKVDDCTKESVEVSDGDKKLPAKKSIAATKLANDDDVEVSDGDKKLPAKKSIAATKLANDDDDNDDDDDDDDDDIDSIPKRATDLEDKKTPLQELQSIVDRNNNNHGKEEAQMPRRKGRMLRIGDDDLTSSSGCSRSSSNTRALNGDDLHILDGYHSPSPPFDVEFVSSLSLPDSPFETNGETQDGGGDSNSAGDSSSVGSGSTTKSERRRRYEQIDDTLTVGDCITVYNHDKYTSGKITGWYHEDGTYRPYLQSKDPYKIIHSHSQLKREDTIDNENAAIVYKESSEAKYYRSGKKCCHYIMNVNEAEDDIRYVTPGSHYNDTQALKQEVLSGNKFYHCPVVTSNPADTAECRIRISKHFEKLSRKRTNKLFTMLNEFNVTLRNAAQFYLGTTSEQAQYREGKKTKDGTFLCTNCREEYKVDGKPHYYTCKCQFDRLRNTYCSMCINDEGVINKERTIYFTTTPRKSERRKSERRSPLTKKMKAYTESKKRRSLPSASAKKSKKRSRRV